MFTLITFLVKFAENLTTSRDKRNVDLITNAGKGAKHLMRVDFFLLSNKIQTEYKIQSTDKIQNSKYRQNTDTKYRRWQGGKALNESGLFLLK